MQIIDLSEKEKEAYNRFVLENETGSFLQSWEWGEWQSALGRQVYRCKLQVESGEVFSMVQFVKMPLPFGKYYLYAPYGPVTNLRFKIEDLRFITQEIKNKFPEAIFIRIETKNLEIFKSLNLPIFKSYNIQPGKTLVINLAKSEDQLLGEMHSKTRYNIRLAEKHGIEVKSDLAITPGHGLYFKEVIDQISETEKRQGFKGHRAEYYKKMVDFFGIQNRQNIKLQIYKAIYKSELLASAIMVDCGPVRTYLFGGSSETNKNLMAPYLMHFQAMVDAKNVGLRYYDFWGIETASGKTPGFARFKLGFGGEVKDYAGAYDMVIKKAWYKFYQTLRMIKKTLTFMRILNKLFGNG